MSSFVFEESSIIMNRLLNASWKEQKRIFIEILEIRYTGLKSRILSQRAFIESHRQDAQTEIDHRESLGVLDERFSDIETKFIKCILKGKDSGPSFVRIPPNDYYNTPRRLPWKCVVDIVFYEIGHEITRAIDDAIMHDGEVEPYINLYSKLYSMAYRLKHAYEMSHDVDPPSPGRFRIIIDNRRRHKAITLYDKIRTEVSIATGTNNGDLEYRDFDGYHQVHDIDSWPVERLNSTKFRLRDDYNKHPHGVYIHW